MSTHQLFLGRQPIVGRDGQLLAYELLMRTSMVNAATIIDDVAASASVIQYAFSDLGLSAVLGQQTGYINIPQDLLTSDMVEFLPKDNVVLELLETVQATPQVVLRCAQLQERGYRMALDDIIAITDSVERLLPFVQVVKIDILKVERPHAVDMARYLTARNIQVLAEKVETFEDFTFYRDNHFDLFQGYYFARPSVLSGKTIQPSAVAMLRVLSLVVADAELEPLVAAIKHSPGLALQVLKVANAAAFRLNTPISSLHQAVKTLGRQQLARIVQIMVFAQRNGRVAHQDPLLQTALVRGRMMEQLTAALHHREDTTGRAFMVGMLSMIEPLFEQPMHELLVPLNLDAALCAALLEGTGELGRLLRIIELTELGDLSTAATQLADCGLADITGFNHLHIEALAWAGRCV